MPSTFSPSLRIELISAGEQAGTWGTTTNTNLGTLVEASVAGTVTVSVTTANQALTIANGAADQARNAVLQLTTTTGAPFAVYAPPDPKQYTVYNASAHAATVFNSTVDGNTTAAGTGVTIPAGETMTIWSNGTDFRVQNSRIEGSITGNAATATTLQTPRAINGTSFNGSANVTVPVNTSQKSDSVAYQIPFVTSVTAGNQDLFTDSAANITYNPSTNTLTTTTFSGALTGNASTATTLQTPRNIGGVSFNGSADINLPGVNTAGNQNTTGSAATLTTARTINGTSFNGSANVTVPVNTSQKSDSVAYQVPFVTSVTAGNQDLFTDSAANITYNPSTNTLTTTTFSGALSGNAATATTLQTARTIGGVSFNGSANINLPGVNTAGNQNTTGNAATATSADTLSGTTVGSIQSSALGAGTADATTFLRGDRTFQTVPTPTIASTAEAEAGTNNTNFLTPLRLREGLNASGGAPVYAARAWVNFQGTGTVAIRESGNVSSVTDNGTGDYTVNFATAMPDSSYANSGSSTGNIGVSFSNPLTLAAGSIRIQTQNASSTKHDSATVTVAVFR